MRHFTLCIPTSRIGSRVLPAVEAGLPGLYVVLHHYETSSLMSRWSSGYLLDYEPRGSGSIPQVRNLEICILRIPSFAWSFTVLRWASDARRRTLLWSGSTVSQQCKTTYNPGDPASTAGKTGDPIRLVGIQRVKCRMKCFFKTRSHGPQDQDYDGIRRIHISRFLTSGIEPEPRGS